MPRKSGGVLDLHAAACFAGKTYCLDMGVSAKTRIMEASLRVSI